MGRNGDCACMYVLWEKMEIVLVCLMVKTVLVYLIGENEDCACMYVLWGKMEIVLV
jgi:hypothetical protein